ncbi:MAG: type II secretion system protein GspK [Candidatus Binatia bacterium]
MRLHPRRRRQRGVALLLVLWVFMILGVLALDFGQYMRDDANAALNLSQETTGYYIAVAGMYRALWLAQQEHGDEVAGSGRQEKQASGATQSGGKTKGKSLRDHELSGEPVPVDGEWHAGEFGGGRYEVRLTDQGGLVSLNKANEALLTRLITGLVLGPTAAVQGENKRSADAVASLVDTILDYRDADHLKRLHGAEDERGYRAKNAPFDSVEELLRLPGVTPELVFGGDGIPGLRDLVSVYSRTDKINVRTAPLPLLAVLLGKDAAGVEALATDREADLEAFVARVLGEAQTIPGLSETLVADRTDLGNMTVLVEARADVARDRNRASVAAVVDIGGDRIEGPKIRYWFDRAPWGGVLPSVPGAEGVPG